MGQEAEVKAAFPEVHTEYDTSKYKERAQIWSKTQNGYLERYFTVYNAKAKPNSIFGNQLIYFAPSSISLVMLDEDHPFLTEIKPFKNKIKSIKIDYSEDILSNPAKGKRKKGAAKLVPSSCIATIKVQLETQDNSEVSEKSYPICASLYGSIVEINQKIIEDPKVLFDNDNKQAYIAIILPHTYKIPETDPNMMLEDTEANNNQIIEEETNENKEILKEDLVKSGEKAHKLSRFEKRKIKMSEQDKRDALNPNVPFISLKTPLFSFDEILEE